MLVARALDGCGRGFGIGPGHPRGLIGRMGSGGVCACVADW